MIPHDTIENRIRIARTICAVIDDSLMRPRTPPPSADGAVAPSACIASSSDPSVRKQASGQAQNAPLGQRGSHSLARVRIAVKHMVGLEFPSLLSAADAPLPSH